MVEPFELVVHVSCLIIGIPEYYVMNPLAPNILPISTAQCDAQNSEHCLLPLGNYGLS